MEVRNARKFSNSRGEDLPARGAAAATLMENWGKLLKLPTSEFSAGKRAETKGSSRRKKSTPTTD